MKKILVPTDFSECAGLALNAAILLAKKTNARIHVLHLLFTPSDWIYYPFEAKQMVPEKNYRGLNEVRSLLDTTVQKVLDAGVEGEGFLEMEPHAKEIHRHVKEHNIDLLVMGTHGVKTKLAEMIGSNTQYILRKSTIPVLVLKNKLTREFHNLLWVSDFQNINDQDVSNLLSFIDPFVTQLHTLTVKTSDTLETKEKTTERIDQLLTSQNYQRPVHKHFMESETIAQGLEHFLKRRPMDCVALFTHGKSGIRQLFSPSLAEDIANHLPLPILSIRMD